MLDPASPPVVKPVVALQPALAVEGDQWSSCALGRDAHLHCWGDGWGPLLAEPSALPVASLPAELTVHQFSNRGFLCALLSDESMRCTKLFNMDERLGFASSVRFGSDPAVGVTTGLVTCVLRRSGAVKCFGDGTAANFDVVGKDVDLKGRRALALAAGSRHACAIVEGEHTLCWGDNGKGQLGQGNVNWAGNLPLGAGPVEVSLGTTARLAGITAGDEHTCVWFEDGRLKCWGGNDDSQLGLGDLLARGDKPGQMGDQLGFVDLGQGAKVVEADAGPSTTCALLSDQRVKCWGWGYTPASSDGKTPTGDRVAAIAF
ncbi:MAG TPA: hypothetical protein VGJ91_12075 [Polyangiaceae bacterium]